MKISKNQNVELKPEVSDRDFLLMCGNGTPPELIWIPVNYFLESEIYLFLKNFFYLWRRRSEWKCFRHSVYSWKLWSALSFSPFAFKHIKHSSNIQSPDEILHFRILIDVICTMHKYPRLLRFRPKYCWWSKIDQNFQ